MTGSVDDLGGIVFETDVLAVIERLVRRGGLGSFYAEPRGLRGHHLQEGQIILIEENGCAGEGFKFERAANMIDVSVGDEDLLEGETESSEAAVDAADFVARVDDDGFAGFLVA